MITPPPTPSSPESRPPAMPIPSRSPPARLVGRSVRAGFPTSADPSTDIGSTSRQIGSNHGRVATPATPGRAASSTQGARSYEQAPVRRNDRRGGRRGPPDVGGRGQRRRPGTGGGAADQEWRNAGHRPGG